MTRILCTSKFVQNNQFLNNDVQQEGAHQVGAADAFRSRIPTELPALFVYNVCCQFNAGKSDLANQWLEWLEQTHLSDVCDAGALSACVVQLDARELSFEIRYEFASREAFEKYETNHAPRLRAEGLKLFPPEKGLRYERSTGVVIQTYTREYPQ